jgi:hypothetical protein
METVSSSGNAAHETLMGLANFAYQTNLSAWDWSQPLTTDDKAPARKRNYRRDLRCLHLSTSVQAARATRMAEISSITSKCMVSSPFSCAVRSKLHQRIGVAAGMTSAR